VENGLISNVHPGLGIEFGHFDLIDGLLRILNPQILLLGAGPDTATRAAGRAAAHTVLAGNAQTSTEEIDDLHPLTLATTQRTAAAIEAAGLVVDLVKRRVVIVHDLHMVNHIQLARVEWDAAFALLVHHIRLVPKNDI